MRVSNKDLMGDILGWCSTTGRDFSPGIQGGAGSSRWSDIQAKNETGRETRGERCDRTDTAIGTFSTSHPSGGQRADGSWLNYPHTNPAETHGSGRLRIGPKLRGLKWRLPPGSLLALYPAPPLLPRGGGRIRSFPDPTPKGGGAWPYKRI